MLNMPLFKDQKRVAIFKVAFAEDPKHLDTYKSLKIILDKFGARSEALANGSYEILKPAYKERI